VEFGSKTLLDIGTVASRKPSWVSPGRQNIQVWINIFERCNIPNAFKKAGSLPAELACEEIMAKYICLLNWTDQGAKNFKESPSRLDAAKQLAQKNGCKFEQLFLTMGIYDLVAILDAPDQQSIAKFVLGVGSTGNVRTVTLPAFAEAEYRSLIGSL
jgi:uncharacterized protein with GYD domain